MLRGEGTRPNRVKWTYVAEYDYILEAGEGKWIIGFLNDEGNPYECPTTTDRKLVEKLEKLVVTDMDRKLMVTVEINNELDKWDKQYPVLIDVRAARVRR
jgi:hypothetical protein